MTKGGSVGPLTALLTTRDQWRIGMAIEQHISLSELNQLLRLDPETGRLYWRERTPDMLSHPKMPASSWNARYAGTEAFASISNTGYRFGGIKEHKERAHRIVFALYHGRWPVGPVDHIDGNRLNNVPTNLREASNSENQWNRKRDCRSTSGFIGVSQIKKNGRWRAFISVDRRQVFVGSFAKAEEAAKARDAAALAARGQFARLNFPVE